MPLPTSIKTLLSGNVVEWARIEFKESWKPESSLKTITAFANDIDNWGGGYIVIGVAENNGRPVLPVKGIPVEQIDVVEFPEGVGGDRIIEKIFKGPLHHQLREALQYIQNSVIKEKIIKYPDRAEADRFFNYPFAAIEEALANAVYHKAYDVREPIEVRVEEKMIEIISHPGPDRSVTIDGLKNFHVSNRRYRNRRIGEFLKELHLTEGRNTGFRETLIKSEIRLRRISGGGICVALPRSPTLIYE